MSPEATSPRRKVAVLGGGAGSMAAVWALTSLPRASERFDITVYQMGWRLGGKGASGRNAAFGNRIEEHGLHVWAGFYRNAFRMMRELYAAQPQDGRLFKQWSDAFKRHNHVLLEEHIDGEWLPWPIALAEDPIDDADSDPTSGGELPPPGEYVRLVLDAMLNYAHSVECDLEAHVDAPEAGGWFRRLVSDCGAEAASLAVRGIEGALAATGDVAVGAVHAARPHLRAAHGLAAALPEDPAAHPDVALRAIVHLVRDAMSAANAVLAPLGRRHTSARRLNDFLSLAGATVVGLIEDNVLERGVEAINDEDWTDWMRRHGARPEALASAMVRGIYDYVFGYEQGRADRPALEAGTATNGILRLFFTFKGSLFWEMQAGMGDVVFAPAYEVLRARGVTFRFFHRVEALEAGDAGDAVQRIRMRRQARVEGAEYEPLRTINGVPSWPSAPDLSQIEDGAHLADVDFESAWAPPTGEVFTLERGVDFDDVILGVSVGGVKEICRSLGTPDSRFQQMLRAVQTVQTCSMQLWLEGDAAANGVPQPPPIASCYVDEMNTWSDMSFLLPRETWPAGGPGTILYLCAQFPDADVIPPYSDHEFPSREQARLRRMAIDFLNARASTIWKRCGTGTAFDWSRLYDRSDATGEARLVSQYLRVNIDPSERYVLSLPGTSKFRLRAGESGFSNLFLAGDWVGTSINAGCVEAAVMAGMDAAASLSGDHIEIIGGLAS